MSITYPELAARLRKEIRGLEEAEYRPGTCAAAAHYLLPTLRDSLFAIEMLDARVEALKAKTP